MKKFKLLSLVLIMSMVLGCMAVPGTNAQAFRWPDDYDKYEHLCWPDDYDEDEGFYITDFFELNKNKDVLLKSGSVTIKQSKIKKFFGFGTLVTVSAKSDSDITMKIESSNTKVMKIKVGEEVSTEDELTTRAYHLKEVKFVKAGTAKLKISVIKNNKILDQWKSTVNVWAYKNPLKKLTIGGKNLTSYFSSKKKYKIWTKEKGGTSHGSDIEIVANKQKVIKIPKGKTKVNVKFKKGYTLKKIYVNEKKKNSINIKHDYDNVRVEILYTVKGESPKRLYCLNIWVGGHNGPTYG